MNETQWRHTERRFHFWAAAAFSAWSAVYSLTLVAKRAASSASDPGTLIAAIAFGVLAAVMANVARIRRRRLQ